MAEQISVVNPRGQRPPLTIVPMAPRLDSLDGKTIYIVDIRFSYTVQFTEELRDVLAELYPRTRFIHREKAGPYGEADPVLWEEIKREGHGAMIGTGH